MFSLYLFALVVGGGMLLLGVFGQDVDDVGGGHGHVGHGGYDEFQFLSLRTLTYFLFGFGAVGAVLSKLYSRTATPLVLAIAIGTGLLIGAIVSFAFRYLARTGSGDG